MGTAASGAPQAVRWTIRKARLLGVMDPTWFAMDVPGGRDLHLNVDDIDDLRSFIGSARVQPLLAVLVTTLMVDPSDEEAIDTVERAMRDEAKRWSIDQKNDWHDHFDQFWDGLVDLFSTKLPSLEENEHVREEFAEFADFASNFSRAAPDYRSRFVGLASDIEALIRAADAAEQVSAAVRNGSLPGIIAHSDVDEPADFAKLYVPRILQDHRTGKEIPSAHLISAGQGFRFVLLGNPGAGKSTFVRHLSWELAQQGTDAVSQPALIVRCREYASKSFNVGLVDYLSSQARTDHCIDHVNAVDIQNGILLGKYVVIFDGLDEITDVNQRLDFCTRVERFAAAHPLCSVLVTSREVGYSRAPINAAKFDHLSLREFTEDQVRNYVENWFSLRQREELISPFMAESVSVSDLRSNPLLLSLLCILYRARGAIPRRRRDIYGKCADLLFNTWDSHRQIEQPEELPAYGHRLMQEIARWVYSSPSAQNGLEQRVIEKVIASYLESVGVTPDQARQRSHEFLEFCAGRAWLLGAFGTNDYGDKIFNFTHRTFYEYFAAEAMSRLAKSTESLGGQVLAAYKADGTSVLPELLVQAYDERVERGGAELFRLIVETSGDATLILRLMNGSLLPAKEREKGFREILQLWRRAPHRFDEQGYDALFSLEPNALLQFKQEFLEENVDPARMFFARGWAAVVLDARTHIFSTDVEEMADEVARTLVAEPEARVDPLVRNWFVLRGDLEIEGREISPFLSVSTAGPDRVGAAWILLTQALSGNSSNPSAVVSAILHDARYSHLSSASFRSLGKALLNQGGRDAGLFSSELLIDYSEKTDRDLYAALTAIALGLSEEGMRPGWMVPRVKFFAGTVEDLEECRRAALSKGQVDLGPDVTRRAAELVKKLPTWAARWVEGDGQLTRVESRPVEDFDRYIFG